MNHKYIFLIFLIILSTIVLFLILNLSLDGERHMQDLLDDGNAVGGFLVMLFWLMFHRRNNKKIGKAFAEYQSEIEAEIEEIKAKAKDIQRDKKKKFEEFLKSLSKSEVFCLKCFSKNLVFKENKGTYFKEYLRKDGVRAKIKTSNYRIDFFYKGTDWECKKCNLMIHTKHKNVPDNFQGPPLNFIYSHIEVEKKYFNHVMNEYRETGFIPSDFKSDWPGYEDLDDRNNYKKLRWDHYYEAFEPPPPRPFIKPKVFPAFISGFLLGALGNVLYRITLVTFYKNFLT